MESFGDELSLGSNSGFPRKVFKLEEHIKKLEEEKRNIKRFDLELPLSFEILNDVILHLKEENKKCSRFDDTQPLLKDFIYLNNQRFSNKKINDILEIERSEEEYSNVETGLGLGLGSSSMVNEESKRITFCGFISNNSIPQPQPQPQPLPPFLQKQALRKQRRCWTPELHCRFLDALQHLGGPGVATPKQIREHMQEEGLTNDEVKSHLQKYRLQVRKPASKQSKVVLGFKLWNEETGESSKIIDSYSDSPQGPLQFPCTITGGDSSMEDAEDAKSESLQMERLKSP